MANPLIALSATSAVVTFLNLGVTLLERGRLIHSPPKGGDFVLLESRRSVLVLSALNERLKRSLKKSAGCLTKDEQGLEELGRKSSKVADDLLVRLDHTIFTGELAQERQHRQELSKKFWAREDLDTLSRRLSTFKLEIETQIVPFLM
jgi:hypothetical protein